jgi:GNAT superfamily N-acetyltransferase
VHPVDVRAAVPDDADACVAVLAALPSHFTPDTHRPAATAVRAGGAWVAAVADRTVGFLVVEQRFPQGAEITYAAVLPGHQGRGIGAALVAEAVRWARTDGLRALEVKTLDASSGYEPYVATRAFWERRGFVQIDRIDPLPGWQPGNPSAIYILPLP